MTSPCFGRFILRSRGRYGQGEGPSGCALKSPVTSLIRTRLRVLLSIGWVNIAADARAIPLTIRTTNLGTKVIYRFAPDSDTASLMDTLGLSMRALGNSRSPTGSS
jgi:hypothetical protein